MTEPQINQDGKLVLTQAQVQNLRIKLAGIEAEITVKTDALVKAHQDLPEQCAAFSRIHRADLQPKDVLTVAGNTTQRLCGQIVSLCQILDECHRLKVQIDALLVNSVVEGEGE